VLDILEPGREVRNAAAAETEAAKECNETIRSVSFRVSYLLIVCGKDLLGSSTRNKFHSSHLSHSAHRAVNRCRTLLQRDQRGGACEVVLWQGLLGHLLLRHSLLLVVLLLDGLHAWLLAVLRLLFASVLRLLLASILRGGHLDDSDTGILWLGSYSIGT